MSERRANFGDIFKDHVASDRLAAIDLALPGEPRHVTYGDLDRLCDSIAGGLVAAGFGEGDRVGVLALNRVEYIAVLFGAVRAGCVPVPINVKLPRDAVEYILNDAGVRLLFAIDLRSGRERKRALGRVRFHRLDARHRPPAQPRDQRV